MKKNRDPSKMEIVKGFLIKDDETTFWFGAVFYLSSPIIRKKK